MVGVAGYLLRNGVSTMNLINDMLSECRLPYVENEVVRIAFSHGKALGMVVPRGKALYDFAYNEAEEKGAIVYGYAIVDRRRLTAKEVMEMSEEKLHKTLKKVDGSFLIVKLEKERVRIATDWLSTRPLYYAIVSDGMVFSSCFWSVLRFFREMKHPIKLDDTAILSYLWLGRIGVIGNRTFVEGVSLAPPGTIITYDLRSHSIQFYRYYQLQYKTEIRDERLAADLIYYTILKSFKQVLDILPKEMKRNMCVFLSGGLDSRVTLFILSQYVKGLSALTYGPEKCDEILIARRVAKEIGIKHIVKKYDLNELADYAYETIRLSDAFCSLSNFTHGIYALRMLHENKCQLFTTGFGLDVALGSMFMKSSLKFIRNETDFYSYILKQITVFNFKELIHILDLRFKYQLLNVLCEFKKLINNCPGDNYLNKNDAFFLYTRARRWTLNGLIILRYISEEILPTISRKFVELIAKIDPNLRMNYRVYRRFLLKLNKKLASIPYNKKWVPPILPNALWNIGYIPKKLNDFIRKITKGRLGLNTSYYNFDEALRCKRWRKLLYETVLNRESLIYKFGYLKYEPIKVMIIEHLSRKRNHGEKLGYIMSLELVLREISKYTA